MKQRILIIISGIMYFLSLVLLGFYAFIEIIKKNYRLTIDGKIILLLLIFFLMYIGGLILVKKYSTKILKINLIIWLILYIHLFLTLMVFKRGFNYEALNIFSNKELSTSFNIIPFKTIIGYLNNNINIRVFFYNVFGNLIVFMPLAFFLPLLFKKQEKYLNFLITTLIIIVSIELCQLVTHSGSFDIDDVILNVLGASIMFGILKLKSINNLLKNIFLLEKNKINYQDLIKKILIIISVILVLFIPIFSVLKKDNNTKSITIIDKTKTEFACSDTLEYFYQDEKYIYYFPCLKSHYVIVKYPDGSEENVEYALNSKHITIEDLILNDIEFYKKEK